jgi:AbrB family looped-hinge helix DNA binding protein
VKVTTKGQVTIPQHIRDKLGITPNTEVDFIEEKDRIYLIKKSERNGKIGKFHSFRGAATIKMTTDEIMALTRGDE